MEMKWIAIGMSVFFVAMSAQGVVKEHHEGEVKKLELQLEIAKVQASGNIEVSK